MVETSPPPPDSHSGCARRSSPARAPPPALPRETQNGIVRQRLRHARPFSRALEHKFGAAHAKRIEDALLQKLIERFSGHNFDDAPKNIGGMAVAPKRAGLSGQWQASYAVGKNLVVKMPVENVRFGIGLPDPLAANILVADA